MTRRGARGRQLGLTAVGVALLWGALGCAGYVVGWQSHQRDARSVLVGSERSLIRHRATSAHPAPCTVSAPATGQLAGLLRIPALGLTAPVEEGTDDAELAVAVGHDPSSVWPGAVGTAVLLAHDVSYFVHLNELKPGDTVVYRTACDTVTYTVTGSQVVPQGSPVADSAGPTLVLDTCYPPNALFFTTERLLVRATETTGPAGDGATGALGVPPSDQVAYRVPAAPALVAQGLTLQQNEAPMGTMTLAGAPSPTWEQSPGPLALEAAALEAYFGGLKATSQRNAGWWSSVADPGVLPPPALRGATITGHDSPLDVTIDSTHGVADEVALTTTVTVSGGEAPGTYAEAVTASVVGGVVRLAGWSMVPA